MFLIASPCITQCKRSRDHGIAGSRDRLSTEVQLLFTIRESEIITCSKEYSVPTRQNGSLATRKYLTMNLTNNLDT